MYGDDLDLAENYYVPVIYVIHCGVLLVERSLS